jgi:hypothetical protein
LHGWLIATDKQLSKKSALAGADCAGECAAAIYSPIDTAEPNGFDPENDLRHVLTYIAEHPANCIDGLLPGSLGSTVAPSALTASRETHGIKSISQGGFSHDKINLSRWTHLLHTSFAYDSACCDRD